LLIQDEYDMPRKSCTLIRRLGIQTVFTTVPKEFVHQFYPPSELPTVKFKSCLTGYIPDELPFELVKPVSERPIWLAYRGRKLPVWYGQLGFEKLTIAKRMKAECLARSIPHDIEWEEEKRIGGRAWFSFVTNAKAVLGTESGSNVMDAWGDIRRGVQALSSERPDLSEEEIYEASVAQFENNVRMNQISPKIFEAIALKTGLVLFEGSYSNIIKPDEHFIPLRKDYGNVDDVFNQLSDRGVSRLWWTARMRISWFAAITDTPDSSRTLTMSLRSRPFLAHRDRNSKRTLLYAAMDQDLPGQLLLRIYL
jgi:hypothetical protein